MSGTHSLAERLREVLLDGRWIANTNISEQIKDLDWKEAVHQIGELNTIAALCFHLNYYLNGLLTAFNTASLEISDKYSFSLEPIESEDSWQKLRTDFLRNCFSFIELVESMDEKLLDQPFIDPKYGSYRRNIEGVIEHSYYHLGQIVFLKKLIRCQPGK